MADAGGSNGSTRPPHPPVLIPPPLLYIGSVLLGVVIHRLIPIRAVPDGLASWIGAPAVAIGVIVLIWSFREFGTLNHHVGRPTSALVLTGPFRLSRNPMYLGMSVLQAGIGIWVNTLWILVLLTGNVLFIHSRLIPLEERYMAEKFGTPYLNYQTRVRRWL